MDDCLFCKIARGEIPAEKIHEDESTFAFLDANPVAPGHVLVIPKKHGATILDFDNESIGKIFVNVKKITGQVKKALNADGFNIGINQEKAAGAVIPHLHIHIIPRFEGDGGGSIHSIVKNPPKESLPDIAEKIRAAAEPEKEPKEEKEKVEEKKEKSSEKKEEPKPAEKKEKFSKEELEAHEKTWKRMKIGDSKF